MHILGWLVKVGDIGLRKVRSRKRPNRKTVNFDEKEVTASNREEKTTEKSMEEAHNSGDNVADDNGDIDYNSKYYQSQMRICVSYLCAPEK